MQSGSYHIAPWLVAPLLATASCVLSFTPGAPGGADEVRGRLPPLASAGADREVLRGYTTRLAGSGSFSPSRRPFNASWEQLAGTAVHLSNETSLTPTFLAPLEEQTLTFKLAVDDGTWMTADEVNIVVRRQPAHLAPRVRAGPDRFVEGAEDGPTADDVAGSVSADASRWEEIQASRSPRAAQLNDADAITANIYRLVGERDGMHSAPDYLVLFPRDERHAGARAPVAILDAPAVVAPGAKIHLDATASTDANGDSLRFRWEQVFGGPQTEPWPSTATADFVAPTRPQELVVDLFVSDGVLESAPDSKSIVVASSGIDAPIVATQDDSHTHPSNTFVLDADGIPTPADNPAVLFTWQQTYGEEVGLATDPSGRFASFVAPVRPGDLAFVVIAELPDGAVAVASAPAVARVTVVETADNLPPLIYLCAASANTPNGLLQVITASVTDPEADPLRDIVWSATSDPPVLVSLRERAGADIVDMPLCAVNRDLEAAGLTSASSVVYQADFVSPAVPTTVTITLSACDDIDTGACATESSTIGIE